MRDNNDQVRLYCAKLMMKGYDQKEGVDFNEIFLPTVRLMTIRVFMAMCITFDLHMKQFDVKTTFLHGEFEEKKFICSNQKVLQK